MRRLHLIVGFAALAAFLLTGQYMDRVHEHLRSTPDAPRMLFRSAHIYLLFGALINLLLGVYVTPALTAGARRLQQAGSIALLATPAFFLVAFAVEPGLDGLVRPWARPAIYLSLGGVLAHVLAARIAPPVTATSPREALAPPEVTSVAE